MVLRTTIFAIILIAPNSGLTAALPMAGSCEPKEMAFIDSVSWQDSYATIANGGRSLQGTIIGKREHGESFKLSIMYEDPIMGQSETIVFGYTASSSISYRIGTVHYDLLEGGQRVVSSMSGFVDAICVLID
ncbi:hypothetical protein [Ostreiculturibacter nitratireducens]|uniref:hypothetical protein n=1 Tax=Ostreiculturibacter nitratireducens TaxID=3075226 RepID=UPI0031B5B2BD